MDHFMSNSWSSINPIKYYRISPPHQCNPPNYGSTTPQISHQAPEYPNLSPPEYNTVQQVVVTILYYARAVDPTILVTFIIISSEHANSTQATYKSVNWLLNYSSTHSEAITIYQKIQMVLRIHIDASFLSDPEAKIRAVWYHCISKKSADNNKSPPKQPPLNGPFHVKFMTMRNVLASAMEEEL